MTRTASKNPLDHLRGSDLRGIAQLATQATAGVTRLAEGVHQSVWNAIGVADGDAPGRTRGITGLVYKTVHDATLAVGNGVDAVLAGLEPLFNSQTDAAPGTPQREAALAALNGVLGDHLESTDNPLAIPMTVRYRGAALNWEALPPMPEATGRVLLLVHGLCLSDLQWHAQHWHAQHQGQAIDHGAALASARGYTPVYLRYNSGLHTSQSGRELSAQLEQLIAHWPTPIEELSVMGHSMGGLVARSAVHQAQQEARCWPALLENLVFLGTPHHGAPLERAGNWIDIALGRGLHTAPFAKIGKLRSAGITDLRYGHLVAEDWRGRDRFRRRPDSRRIVPLPEGVACYTVAAALAARRGTLADRLVGDGLVPLLSALGQHDEPHRSLAFPKASQRIAYGMNHLGLLGSPDVTHQLVRWLTPGQNSLTANG